MLALVRPASGLTINLQFSGFSPAEEAVLTQAASYWEAGITSAGTVTIQTQSAPLSGGLLGLASNYSVDGSGVPTGGTIQVDNTPGVFFVDPTPADNSEFIGNVSPPTYFQADPLGSAAGLVDLLTLGIHEIGHVLGFSSAFSNLSSNIQFYAGSSQYVYVFQSTPQLGSTADYDPIGGALVAYGGSFGGVFMPQNDPDNEEASGQTGVPSHLEDVFGGSLVAGTFTVDVMNPTLGSDERILIAPVDLDILADAFGYSVVPEPSTFALLALGLAGLACQRRS